MSKPKSPNKQVQCADCWRWIDADRPHSCPQQIAANRMYDKDDSEVGPLCAVHQRLEATNALECEIGNDCVACSLNERREMLELIAPFAIEGNTEDSVTVLRRVVEFYRTHVGEGRVVVSYPATAIRAAKQQ